MKNIRSFTEYVNEQESINEFGPLTGSRNRDELETLRKEASRKSERGDTVYVVGTKKGGYKLSKYFEAGNTFAGYHNGVAVDIDESLEDSMNEAKKIDDTLAKVTVDYLASKNIAFKERVYFSNADKSSIKRDFGGRLPRGFDGVTVGSLLEPLVGETVYIDGGITLIKGNKGIMSIDSKTTWADVKKKLNL